MSTRGKASLLAALLVALAVIFYARSSGDELYALDGAIRQARRSLGAPGVRSDLKAAFSAEDEFPRLAIALETVARGFDRPTDLAFVGSEPPSLVVVQQNGKLAHVDLRSGEVSAWFDVAVEDGANEQGLLGIAFHPQFADSGRFFINYTRGADDEVFSFVAELRAEDPARPFSGAPTHVREILRLAQPFPNHNGGSLAFGPDGMLYIGFGDGGSADDPHGNGQNRKSWLGSILRIDIDGQTPPLAYRIPNDNPFVGDGSYAPEAFAIGARNPWRISFDPKGRLVVADVGQNEWEEVGYALPGDNLGWAIMEGKVCHRAKDCDTSKFRLPFLVYGREQGISVTGGYVVTSTGEGALSGLYLFGDYGSGRLWALELPDANREATRVFTAGAWPIHPSTFGRDRHGRVYVADHEGGRIYRIRAKR